MAIRSDIWIDFSVSPRIIWVQAPTVSVTIQDFVDTIRFIESDPINLSFSKLIDSAGKTFLYNDGVSNYYTGIVLTLLNAKIAFEARGGPSFIQCSINAGDLVAQTSGGASMSPIQPTAYTQVIFSQSTAPTLVTTTSNGVGSAAEVANAVWDAVSSSHNIVGSTGEKLISAGNSGDPWATDISSYTSGTAGYELHNKPTATEIASAVRTELAPELAHILVLQNNPGLTNTQATMLLEMYELLGLDVSKPLIVTQNTRSAGTISQNIISDSTSTIVTRV